MAKDNDKTVYAYSDGSAIGNPGPGGYGVVLKFGDSLRELSQGYVHTTNNRMELLGAIMALESLKKRQRVVLTTDSRYVVDGIEKGWAKQWRANGWIRPRQGRAKNSDMWERLLQVCDRHDVSFRWVRGHTGHTENTRCDELANAAARGNDMIIDEGFVRTGRRPPKVPRR